MSSQIDSVSKIFIYSVTVASKVEDVIRERVRELLEKRPDVSQVEFGRAIGRGYSWVSAFLKGTRHANDVLLLVKIARFFGVTVGYLLRESGAPGDDPGAVTLLAAWGRLRRQRDRDAVLQLALTLQRDEPESDAPSAGRKG